RAVALSSGTLLGVSDLPEVKSMQPRSDFPAEFPAEGIDLERVLADFERGWVMRALERTGGIRKRAATLLGISFRSLRYRLDKLGMSDDKAAEEEPTDS
ncbi:MAG TPA: helix-turn-helix domain-containing protein, partial [Kofleriaceae bacterium]|nr:helix-turn-helix domain-containing protein [Kofleriaceae bacterium]